jgi:hypothetical protein
VDRVDDLARVDPLQVGTGRAEVGMPELALDDVHRNALSGQLDSVPMPELMRRKPASHARVGGQSAQLGTGCGGRPRTTAGGSVDHAEQRPARHLDAMLQPGVEVFEPPIVHAYLAAPLAFPVADQQGPAALVDVGLGQCEGFGDPQPAAPQHSDQRPDPEAVPGLAGRAHDEDDLLGAGRIGRVLPAFVVRHSAAQEAGGRRRRATTSGHVELI